MDAKDWYDCGARIGDLVQKAVDQQNFHSLNDAIMDTISQTVDAALGSVQRNTGGRGTTSTYRGKGRAYQKAKQDADILDPIDMVRSGTGSGNRKNGVNRSAKGIFSMIAGYGMAVVSALAMLTFFILAGVYGFECVTRLYS